MPRYAPDQAVWRGEWLLASGPTRWRRARSCRRRCTTPAVHATLAPHATHRMPVACVLASANQPHVAFVWRRPLQQQPERAILASRGGGRSKSSGARRCAPARRHARAMPRATHAGRATRAARAVACSERAAYTQSGGGSAGGSGPKRTSADGHAAAGWHGAWRGGAQASRRSPGATGVQRRPAALAAAVRGGDPRTPSAMRTAGERPPLPPCEMPLL
mmetsp:Transcript_29705/g.95945  ORF Transcript_29705/g.95945 Transcript_29705/m.95945 type:complete len:218 (+) Transcript_29705:318-971(+)